MSLYIIGSVSRVTSNIVLQLARCKIYSSITIGDLLPFYEFHHRFYRLQEDLDRLKLSQDLKLQKLHQINDIYEAEKSHQDILFITHDYYQHVTSKTKLMQLTAKACQKRNNVLFATPVEYDHFGFDNPENNYLQAQNKVHEIAPNATIIRSDVQDNTESMSYINSNKSFPEEKIFNFYGSQHFSPRVVDANYFAKVVVKNLQEKVQGKNLLVQGNKEKKPFEVNYDRSIIKSEYEHARINIAQMTSKYNGLIGQGSEKVAESE